MEEMRERKGRVRPSKDLRGIVDYWVVNGGNVCMRETW